MSDNWLTLIVAPSMAVAPLRLMQTLHQTGAEIVVDPLAGLSDLSARSRRLHALTDAATLPKDKSRRIAVIPASGLYGLVLRDFGIAADGIVRLDTADPARAVVRALRIEAWILGARAENREAPLPIPAEAGFRLTLDPRRFRNMVQEIQIGRTLIDAATEGLAVRQLRLDDGQPADLGISGLPELPGAEAEPLAELSTDPEGVTALIRAQRIDCAGVELPPLPMIDRASSAPVMAFVCGRNTSSYLTVLTNKLLDEGIPLIYIDNGSDDGSADIAAQLLGRGIHQLHHLPYDGSFSVEAQLRMKQALIADLAPRWVLNMDADEILEHRLPGHTITDIIAETEDGGYNAVNFQEFVFLPQSEEDFAGRDYAALMRQYYLFEPIPYRLFRMWRHGVGLSNLDSAGHRLSGPVRVSPVSHNLRHYIALSQQAALNKYVGRVFSPEELARNWHANRVGITENDIRLPSPDAPGVRTLPANDMKGFDRSTPLAKHWWKWQS